MDNSTLQWIIDGFFALAAWIFKQHADTVKENHKDLKARVDMHGEDLTAIKVGYVPKGDLVEFKKDMNDRFDRLEELIRK